MEPWHPVGPSFPNDLSNGLLVDGLSRSQLFSFKESIQWGPAFFQGPPRVWLGKDGLGRFARWPWMKANLGKRTLWTLHLSQIARNFLRRDSLLLLLWLGVELQNRIFNPN